MVTQIDNNIWLEKEHQTCDQSALTALNLRYRMPWTVHVCLVLPSTPRRISLHECECICLRVATKPRDKSLSSVCIVRLPNCPVSQCCTSASSDSKRLIGNHQEASSFHPRLLTIQVAAECPLKISSALHKACTWHMELAPDPGFWRTRLTTAVNSRMMMCSSCTTESSGHSGHKQSPYLRYFYAISQAVGCPSRARDFRERLPDIYFECEPEKSRTKGQLTLVAIYLQ